MAVVFSDNFPSSLNGTNWANQNGTHTWQTPGQVRLSGTTTGGADPAILRTTTSAHAALADCRVTVTQMNTGSIADGGPVVRGTSGAGAGNTCYYLDVNCSGSGTAAVFRRVGGVDTGVGASDAITEAANGIVALEVSGVGATVTLKKYYQGAQVGATISDTNGARIVTAGQTGILSWVITSGTSTDYDAFSVDDLIAPYTNFTVTHKLRPAAFRPGLAR